MLNYPDGMSDRQIDELEGYDEIEGYEYEGEEGYEHEGPDPDDLYERQREGYL